MKCYLFFAVFGVSVTWFGTVCLLAFDPSIWQTVDQPVVIVEAVGDGVGSAGEVVEGGEGEAGEEEGARQRRRRSVGGAFYPLCINNLCSCSGSP